AGGTGGAEAGRGARAARPDARAASASASRRGRAGPYAAPGAAAVHACPCGERGTGWPGPHPGRGLHGGWPAQGEGQEEEEVASRRRGGGAGEHLPRHGRAEGWRPEASSSSRGGAEPRGGGGAASAQGGRGGP